MTSDFGTRQPGHPAEQAPSVTGDAACPWC